MGAIDESFREPGAVPFKWEVKPGVPIVHLAQPHQPPTHSRHHSLPGTRQKLTPPPSTVNLTSPVGPGTQPFHSATSITPDRHGLKPRPLTRPLVVSTSSFLLPLFGRRWSKKKKVTHKGSPEHEPGCACESSDLTRWFESAKKSPQPVIDTEWTGFEAALKVT